MPEPAPRTRDRPAILARTTVAAVFALSVQCALQLILWPQAHAGDCELSGAAFDAAGFALMTSVFLGLRKRVL